MKKTACDNQLEKDIRAVLSLFSCIEEVDCKVNAYQFGRLAGPRWETQSFWSFVASEPDHSRVWGIFDGASPTSRIAVVYSDYSELFNTKGWLEAARTCEVEISGVIELTRILDLDLSASERDIEKRAYEFFSNLPDEFFKAGLPVLFDESGVFTKLSPESIQLEMKDGFSHMSNEEISAGYCAPKNAYHTWPSSMHYPVKDVSGTEIADLIAASIIRREGAEIDYECRLLFANAGVDVDDYDEDAYDTGSGIDGIARVLDVLFSAGQVESTLDELGAFEALCRFEPNWPDFVFIAKDTSLPELSRVLDLFDLMLSESRIAAKWLSENRERVRQNIAGLDYVEKLPKVREMMEADGVDSYLQAVMAGVPVSDVLA